MINKHKNGRLKLKEFIFRLNNLLPKKVKIKFGFCFLLIILSGVSEAFLIASVLPFVSSLLNNGNLSTNPYSNLPGFLTFSESNFTITLVFILAVFVATSIRVINIKYITHIAWLAGNQLVKNAYSNLISLNYLDLYKITTSDVINLFISNLNDTVETIVLLLNSLNSLVVFIFVITSLLVVNTRITLIIIFLFFSVYFYLIRIQANSLRNTSKKINDAQILSSKSLKESKELINQIKLLSKENFFFKRYTALHSAFLKIRSNYVFVTTFPKYALEGILLIIIISLLGIFSSISSSNLQLLLPLFGMFIFAAQRLLPLGQLIYTTRSVFLYYSEPIRKIIEFAEMENHSFLNRRRMRNSKIKNLTFKKRIKLENVFFKYERNPYLVKNLNLQINKGQVLGISTPTGTGKTTLINIIMGFIVPVKGKLLIDDIDIHNNKEGLIVEDWWEYISYVPQNVYLSNTSIKKNIAFALNEDEINMLQVIKCSEIAQSHNYIFDLPNQYDEILLENGSNLSGGQIQRIGIARALYNDPQVLILDEATNALDKKIEEKIIKSIKKEYKDLTIIIISHEKSTLSYCDSVINNLSKE